MKMSATREAREKRNYLLQRRIRRSLSCIYITILVISIVTTLLGFYYLIDHHVDQTVKVSEIKGLQIRATTLAELQANNLELIASNTWADAMLMSGVVSESEKAQDPEFRRSLFYQETVFKKENTTDLQYATELYSTNETSYESNQYIEDAFQYHIKLNETGTEGDQTLINWAKGQWFISLEEIPDDIEERDVINEDIINCAAEVALTKRVQSVEQGKVHEYLR